MLSSTNVVTGPDSVLLSANLSGSNSLQVIVQAKVVWLVGDQIEPQKQEGETGSFIYFSNRPTETFVVYILNKIVLEQLAQKASKDFSALHIHKNVNTEGEVICWPQKIETIEGAEKVLSDWLGLIGALVGSTKRDINEFYDKKNPNWIQDSIKSAGIFVSVVRV